MVTATCYCLHDDHWFLETSTGSLKAAAPVVCYDAVRNTTLKWQQGQLAMTMSYDPASRLTTMLQGAATTAYTFDLNGNLVLENNAGVMTGYAYDKENRMKQVTHSDGSVSTYVYSGDSLRRLRQEPTDTAPHTIVWDGFDYLGEY